MGFVSFSESTAISFRNSIKREIF